MDHSPALTPSVCNNGALRRATRRLGQFYDDALAPSGLRATQFSLLAQVRRADRPAMSDLAEMVVMDLSALGHTLKPLVRAGFVRLMPDERDRRTKRVVLTDAGMQKLREATRLWRAMQDRFDAAFGADEAARLRTTLDYLAGEAFADALMGVRGAS